MFLVDGSTRALINGAGDILGELGAPHPDGEHPRAKHELMQCTVEVITGICESVDDARVDLGSTLGDLREAAARRGWLMACAGTHPFSHWSDVDISPVDRYQQLVADLGWPARRLATHGIHYHVGVPSADASIAVVNSAAYYLPLFLGLSASSPFWHGMDTGLASTRTKIFEGLPTAGLPPHLAEWAEFEQYMATLINAGAISTIREVWWDVRPHPDFGTVELRMCDGITSLDDILAVAALAQCTVADLSQRFEAGDPLPTAREWVLRENKWLASRHGLDCALIIDDSGARRPAEELVHELIDHLAPTAARLGCATELAAVGAMVDRTSSAQRQRAIVDGGGSLTDVIDSLIAEFDAGLRLEGEHAP